VIVRGPDECWEWTGKKGDWGHGRFYGGPDRGEIGAHRFSWELANGPIPAGLNVLHRCDNPPCMNPAHLFLGTFKDNTQDMLAKGRDGHGVMPGEANPAAKLTARQVRQIRRLAAARSATHPEIAARFGVSRQTVSAIHTRANWRSVSE
jgi:hypothetical protein